MKQGMGELVEIFLENGLTGGKLHCPPELIPAPGRYILGDDPAFSAPLPVPLFSAGSIPGGFVIAPPIPITWVPGTNLKLRGPLGQGFSLPASASRVVLVAFDETFSRLKPLLDDALSHAAIVLLTESSSPDLPAEVEVQPLSALPEVVAWADYMAIDIEREALPQLWNLFGGKEHAQVSIEAQILVNTPFPCGGMAECGVCAVPTRRDWKMACKDGPVFRLLDLK